jgi:metal-dependent amidase/aminoacylase/carboxypeptidase family protein
MAFLCGLSNRLLNGPETGTVILLFQPAEEDGSGAQKVFSDTNLLAAETDYVFTLLWHHRFQKIKL